MYHRHALLCVILLVGGCSEAPVVQEATTIGLGVSPEEQQIFRIGLDDTIALQTELERLSKSLGELSVASPDQAERAARRLNEMKVEFHDRGRKDAGAARKWFLEQVRGKSASHFAAGPVATLR
jgi:hypothetical protein